MTEKSNKKSETNTEQNSRCIPTFACCKIDCLYTINCGIGGSYGICLSDTIVNSFGICNNNSHSIGCFICMLDRYDGDYNYIIGCCCLTSNKCKIIVTE